MDDPPKTIMPEIEEMRIARAQNQAAFDKRAAEVENEIENVRRVKMSSAALEANEELAAHVYLSSQKNTA